MSTLSEDDYRIVRAKDFLILTGCLGILSMKKMLTLKTFPHNLFL